MDYGLFPNEFSPLNNFVCYAPK